MALNDRPSSYYRDPGPFDVVALILALLASGYFIYWMCNL